MLTLLMIKATARFCILINCLQHRVQSPFPSNTPTSTTDVTLTWNPPQTEHILIPCDPTLSPINSETSGCRYPLCTDIHWTGYKFKLEAKLFRGRSICRNCIIMYNAYIIACTDII